MKKFAFCLTLAAFIFGANVTLSAAQYKYPFSTGNKTWNASWCSTPESDGNKYEILHFRRTFDLPEKPEKFEINVSADNRFRLYVNGKSIATGPARGDLEHWRYDTIDISPYLKKGKNTIAALVWNYAEFAPAAQVTNRTGFILDGATKAEEFIATPANWKVKVSSAYSRPEQRGFKGVNNFSFTGTTDAIDGSKYDWGWTSEDFDDSSWADAKKIAVGMCATGPYGENQNWMLVKREIPQLEEKLMRLSKIRKHTGVENPSNFIKGEKLTIPANSECSFILDNDFLTNAYVHFVSSRGKGSVVKVTYAEALFDKNGKKGNRNSIEGRDFSNSAPFDVFMPDGGTKRDFSTLWFRTYRYVSVDIKTADEPLDIEDFYGVFTGYPFKEKGSFETSDKSVSDIWNVGWRTARLCAIETYFDCPYYEQLQYVGDTRIQALISLYVSGDDRLARQAISNFDYSRGSDGLVKSRYPTRVKQYIPPFALYWVSMLDDFAKHRDDPQFIKEHLDGVRAVFGWFFKQIDPKSGMLRPMLNHWNFVDWVTTWKHGYAPETEDAASSINSLHFAYALKSAANLMRYMGCVREADEYAQKSREIADAVRKNCYDESKGLFMNYAGAEKSSQHANIMAILADAIPAEKQRELFEKIISDKSLDQCTFYYRFYLTEAMRKVGASDKYADSLDPWRDMLNIGLTTFAETPEPTRSDCHAWSSSPNYHLLSLVCGVNPGEYGFKSVRIEPNLGKFDFVEGKVPHPNGIIELSLKNSGGKLEGKVVLPEKLDGVFIHNGKEIKLKSGQNSINI